MTTLYPDGVTIAGHRLEPTLAATYAVRRFGPDAMDVEICAKHQAWETFWGEVERLLLNGNLPEGDNALRADYLMKGEGTA